MTTPLRPCGRERCRLCNPRPIHDESRLSLAVGLVGIALALFFVVVLLPGLAG